MDRKNAEATLQEFSAFSVTDNWLDDDLVALIENDEFEDFSENAKPLDEQLEEWEQDDDDSNTNANGWVMQGDEPWDRWGEETDDEEDDDVMRVAPNTGRY